MVFLFAPGQTEFMPYYNHSNWFGSQAQLQAEYAKDPNWARGKIIVSYQPADATNANNFALYAQNTMGAVGILFAQMPSGIAVNSSHANYTPTNNNTGITIPVVGTFRMYPRELADYVRQGHDWEGNPVENKLTIYGYDRTIDNQTGFWRVWERNAYMYVQLAEYAKEYAGHIKGKVASKNTGVGIKGATLDLEKIVYMPVSGETSGGDGANSDNLFWNPATYTGGYEGATTQSAANRKPDWNTVQPGGSVFDASTITPSTAWNRLLDKSTSVAPWWIPALENHSDDIVAWFKENPYISRFYNALKPYSRTIGTQTLTFQVIENKHTSYMQVLNANGTFDWSVVPSQQFDHFDFNGMMQPGGTIGPDNWSGGTANNIRTGLAGGFELESATDSRIGEYIFLDDGYSIVAKAPGFYHSEVTNVKVPLYKITVNNVNFALQEAIATNFVLDPNLDLSKEVTVLFTTLNKNNTAYTGSVSAVLNDKKLSVVRTGAGKFAVSFTPALLGITAVKDIKLVISLDNATDPYLPLVIGEGEGQNNYSVFSVYLAPHTPDVNIGETISVDLMLNGDINYTQIATEITFDTTMLEYVGYNNLAGWAAAVTKPAADKVAVRSVPGMNMVAGAPCPNVRIVTLEFRAKANFTGDDIATQLTFASAVVSPQGGVTGAGVVSDKPADIIVRRPVQGAIGNVYLITGQEIEVDFDAPVTANNFRQTFDVFVDNVKVDYEFLSYFDFGSYAARGGVLNLRLPAKLDAGEPRGRKRESAPEAFLARTEHTKGPVAAAKVRVEYRGTPNAPVAKTSSWKAFWGERHLGYMSRVFDYVSVEGGSNGSVAKNTTSGINDLNISASMAEGRYPLYSDEFICRQVGEGVHRFFGRAEFLALPMCRAKFTSYLVGPSQSVYEAPEFRELYKHGETTDLYTRVSIKATEVPGNFDPVTGYFKKPFIVGTSDDVMRHDTPINAAGQRIFDVSTAGVITPIVGIADTKPARPRTDQFYFGEAFFDIFYELGVLIGSKQYPVGPNNNWDDNRYDVHVERAYAKAKAAGKWPNTDMMKSAKDYYVYGAMAFLELIPESQAFQAQAFPVNTRSEMYDYDYDLYWTLSGIHGKYEYWTGVGNLQGASTLDDTSKWRTPWFWGNQPDNFGPPATANGTVGVAYAPLHITNAVVTANNQLMIYFNREVRTRANVIAANQWRVKVSGKEITVENTLNESGTGYATGAIANNAIGAGYTWKSIRLTIPSGTSDPRLDNGKPYGRAFRGFSQADIGERSVSKGGWIADNQAIDQNALNFGEFVDLKEAIRRGAGIAEGGVKVEFLGARDVLDWQGNKLALVEVAAEFEPWIGVAYRCPLTGLYIYMDTAVGTNPNTPYNQKEVAITAGMVYESILQGNETKRYEIAAGEMPGDDGLGNIGSGYWRAFPTGSGTASGGHNAGPVTYDRTGQRIADYAVRQGGGMLMPAGSVLGHHPGRQPNSTGVSGTSMGDSLRVEGWGGTTFQCEDVLIMRDFNLCRYKNENLALHEGGHGVDSFTGTSSYANYVYRDITSAHATATHTANGRRWFTVDDVGSYVSSRGEYVSTGNTFIAGTMRESFQGNNDGVWTGVGTRNEYYRYDPWGFEAHRRFQWNGELGLWYENKVGDPDYRVMIEDWEVLRDQNAEFAHWTISNDLASWGATIVETSRHNPYIEARNGLPYGSQLNDNVRWVSWNVPNVWDSLPTIPPSNPNYPNNRFDFPGYDFTSNLEPAGGNPYHPMPPIWHAPVAELTPFQNQTHPFHRPGGVPKPVRTPDLLAKAAPVTGTISGVKVSEMRPNVVEFTLTNPSGEVTSNNAQTSFDLLVNGKYLGFYFWTYKVAGTVATVQLRLDRPLEGTETLQVVLRSGPAPTPEVVEEVEEAVVDVIGDDDLDTDTDFDTDTDTDDDDVE
jgi:hypothetical protein